MRIEQALNFLHASKAAQFESLSELIISLLGEEGALPAHTHGAPLRYPQRLPASPSEVRGRSIEILFHDTATRWHHPGWAGLQLLAVDGVMWRTPDTPDDAAAFAKPSTQQGKTAYHHHCGACCWRTTCCAVRW